MDKYIFRAIKPLKKLMEDYGMETKDWCISGESAWIIFEYKVPVREKHLDIYVKESAIPWKIRDEMQTIPPKGSEELEKYSDFVEKHHIALHMVPLPKPKITEQLIDKYAKIITINGVKVNVINPTGNLFDLEVTLKSYKKIELGKDRLTRWKQYLEAVYKKSFKNKNIPVQKKVVYLLKKYFNTAVININK